MYLDKDAHNLINCRRIIYKNTESGMHINDVNSYVKKHKS